VSTSRYRKAGELASMLLLLAGSLFMLWASYGISGFESVASAGVFPMLASAVMVLTAAIALRECLQAARPLEQGSRAAADPLVHRILPPVLVWFAAAILIYTLALERLGFVLSSFVFLAVSMRLLGSRRWLLNLVVSALVLAAIYLIFRTAFSVVLPTGIWLQGWLK
jgi:putative tricarboxylic transport membrane protein